MAESSVRILLTNGREVVYRFVAAHERQKIEKAITNGETVRVEEDGRSLILNPAHIIAVVDMRPDEIEQDTEPPSAAAADGRCGTCRGRGTIVRLDHGIKVETVCESCGGSGKP